MELLNCKLCNYKAKQLHQHLKAVHNMSSKEYRDIFGKDLKMQTNFTLDLSQTDPYHSNYVKNGYSKIKSKLNSISPYNRLVLVDKLLNNDLWKKYTGKTKYRTMIKDDIKLYASIMFYTRHLDTKLENRMKFILNYQFETNKCYCSCGKKMTFGKFCRKCPEPKRLKILARLDEVHGRGAKTLNYNPNSIPFLESVAKQYNVTDLIHAENKGEKRIAGFAVDGYSPKKNIVFEFDEKHHFNGNLLKDKDIKRQNIIIERIGCRFIRINESGEVYYDSKR